MGPTTEAPWAEKPFRCFCSLRTLSPPARLGERFPQASALMTTGTVAAGSRWRTLADRPRSTAFLEIGETPLALDTAIHGPGGHRVPRSRSGLPLSTIDRLPLSPSGTAGGGALRRRPG